MQEQVSVDLTAYETLNTGKISMVKKKTLKNVSKPFIGQFSKKIKKQKVLKAQKKNLVVPGFKCSHCSRAFFKAVSLGGHVSKSHPGKQSNYTKKMEIYRARTKHRQNLVLSK